MDNTDVLILGGGGAGYPAAFRLAKAGLDVMIVDPKGTLGGNCLYQGCIPSKTLREVAIVYNRALKTLGIKDAIDYKSIVDRKDRVQEIRFDQHNREIKESTVKFISGIGEIKDTSHAIIHTNDGKDIEIKYKNLIIATGSEPVKPNISGSEYAITSDELYKYKTDIRELPNDMVIIGGGYIALETASIFSTLGSKVHVLVRSDKMLKSWDSRLVNTLLPILLKENKNMEIIYNAPTLEIQKTSEKEYKVIYSKDNEKKEMITNLVMFATGRKPVYPKGIENLGINYNEKGIMVDETIRTNIANVYAPGDVNGKSMFFHSAVRQSLVAAHNILSGAPSDYMDFQNVPIAVYTIPSAAFVGILPEEASKRNINIIEAHCDLENDVMSQIFDERYGELRLFFERGTLRLVGGWIIGFHAPSIINEIGIAVENNLTAYDLAKYPDAHPETNECIAYTARSIL